MIRRRFYILLIDCKTQLDHRFPSILSRFPELRGAGSGVLGYVGDDKIRLFDHPFAPAADSEAFRHGFDPFGKKGIRAVIRYG